LAVCKFCEGDGYTVKPEGGYTRCDCFYRERMLKVMQAAPNPIRRALGEGRILPRQDYRGFPPMLLTKTSIQPSAYAAAHGFSSGDQQKLFDQLSIDPLAGYGLYGPTGVGKTFLLWALVKEAAYGGQTVFVRSAGRLAQEARGTEIDDSSEHWIDQIQEFKRGTHVFIDELDGTSTTEFSLRVLFELVSECWNRSDGLRLTIASNLAPKQLSEKIGPATVRRIEDLTSSLTLFSGG
jgi:hypothetical protein